MEKNHFDAFKWFKEKSLNLDLTTQEQLALVHIILILNANFWKPAQISINAIGKLMNADKRTAKKAVESLKSHGLISVDDDVYNIVRAEGKPKIYEIKKVRENDKYQSQFDTGEVLSDDSKELGFRP